VAFESEQIRWEKSKKEFFGKRTRRLSEIELPDFSPKQKRELAWEGVALPTNVLMNVSIVGSEAPSKGTKI
jgi:hypothetical protein